MGKCVGMAISALLLSVSVLAQAKPLTGVYQSGHDIDSLQICSSGKGYLLKNDRALKPIRRQISQMRSRQNPYPMLLVTVEGKISSSAAAIEADYDGVVEVSRVLRASAVIPDHCMESLGIK